MNVSGPVCGFFAQVFAMSAWAVLLSKATLLLAVAWLIHGLLARANPRWRMLLWRGAAVGVAVLAVYAIGLPGVEIRVPAPEGVTATRSPLPQPVAAVRD